jgi:hypothetical protein
MHPTDAVACWRNRQAELEFHIRRHEWFLDKSVVPDPEALQHKIDAYRTEWSSYERMIRKASTSHPASRNTRSAA